jgi:SAM-dependent methyltransferase
MAKGRLCPACDSPESINVGQHGGYALLECPRCRLGYSDPMTGGSEDFYKGHVVYQSDDPTSLDLERKAVRSEFNASFLKSLPAGARLLDVGCGRGAFVAFAREMNVDAVGLDFNASQIEIGKSQFGLGGSLHLLDLRRGGLVDLNLGTFDVVSMFEVIEHVEGPRQLLEGASRVMRPGGMMLISCPNEDRIRVGPRIFVDYPPHHLTRWRKQTLITLMGDLGFELVRFDFDCSVADLVWTFLVNGSAKRRVHSDASRRADEGSRARRAKHRAFSAFRGFLRPVDAALRWFGLGTMGMRLVFRKVQ